MKSKGIVRNTFLLLSLLVIHLTALQTSCDADTRYKLMSSKTEYSLVANVTNFDDYKIEGKKILLILKNYLYAVYFKCSIILGYEPIGMWFLSRHGSRYPSQKDIITLNANMLKIKKQILDHHRLSTII